MKKIKFLTVFALVISSFIVVAQTGEEKKTPQWFENGNVFATVFANFHTSITDPGAANAIAIDRAYFGYKTKIDEHFSAAVKVDVGTDPDYGDDQDFKRYMFLKDAYLQYKIGKLTLKGGLAGTFQFKLSEQYWGHRYIYKAYQDASKMGNSADIGLFASYKPIDMLTIDYAIMNGEGYSKVQTDSVFKHAIGVTVEPIDILVLRAYTDVYDVADSARQVTASFFAGLKTDKFTFGAEYNLQMNNKNKYDNDLSGISVSANYKINDKFNVIGRYDFLSSNKSKEVDFVDDNGVTIGTEMVEWNMKNDGSFIIAGLEYSPIKKVNMALNYQHKFQADTQADDIGWLYLNLQFKF